MKRIFHATIVTLVLLLTASVCSAVDPLDATKPSNKDTIASVTSYERATRTKVNEIITNIPDIANWEVVTGGASPASGDKLAVDTASIPCTITLPASPATGAFIYLTDPKSTWGTNNVTLDRNGAKINGVAANYTLSSSGLTVTLIYTGSAYGWGVADAYVMVTADITTPTTTPALVSGSQLQMASLRAIQRTNVQTLSGNRVLLYNDAPFQVLNPNGSDRNVTLPDPALCTYGSFFIANTGSSTPLLNVKDFGAAQIGGIRPGYSGTFYSDGSAWREIGMRADARKIGYPTTEAQLIADNVSTSVDKIELVADVTLTAPLVITAGKVYSASPGAVLTTTAVNTITFASGSNLEDNGGQMFNCNVNEVLGLTYAKPEMFGAIGDRITDDSIPMQCAANCPVMELQAGKIYRCNINLNSTTQSVIIGNKAKLTPAINAPVLKRDMVGGRVDWRNLYISYVGIDTSWTLADGIYMSGLGSSQDYSTVEDVEIRSSTGYGFYAYGSNTAGHTIQRLHVRDCTFVDSQYANLRLEGVVLEGQFIGCFFNTGASLGALPVNSDQLTHPASPSREFRRAAIEILRKYTADNVGNNGLTPNRIIFQGCAMTPDWDNAYNSDNRTAAVYISGGEDITFDTCDFEKPFPAIWLAHEDGTNDSNYLTSSRNVEVRNCKFLGLTNDPNIGGPIIIWDGFSNTIIDNPNITGSSITTSCFLYNNMQGVGCGNLDIRNPSYTGIAFTNGAIYRDPLAYSGTRLAANTRYFAKLSGYQGVVVGKVSSANLHALSSAYLSLTTEFMDGQTTSLSADPSVAGNITVVNDADDGSGGGSPPRLPGRIITASGQNIILDDVTKKLFLRWDQTNLCWRETGRNFTRISTGPPFLCANNKDTTVLSTNITNDSAVQFIPTNGAAVNLVAAGKFLFVTSRVPGVSFVASTADNSAAAGTETFTFVIVNP